MDSYESLRYRHPGTACGVDHVIACAQNPRVFLDVGTGATAPPAFAGRLEIELRADVVPHTAENFRLLCTGEAGASTRCGGKARCYRGSVLHRIIPNWAAMGGDFECGNGRGGESALAGGGLFADENFELKHDAEGVLSMANTGPDSNGSQFFLTLGRQSIDQLDGRSVVFGHIVGGMDLLQRLEKLGSTSGRTRTPVTIVDCGMLADAPPLPAAGAASSSFSATAAAAAAAAPAAATAAATPRHVAEQRTGQVRDVKAGAGRLGLDLWQGTEGGAILVRAFDAGGSCLACAAGGAGGLPQAGDQLVTVAGVRVREGWTVARAIDLILQTVRPFQLQFQAPAPS
jgi:peptidylprolyl isomerase